MSGLLRALVLKPSTIVFLVLGSALLAAFVFQLSRDPGYILLVFGNYTLEMSAVVAAMAFFVLVTALFWGYRFIEWLFDRSRRQNTARKKTTKGLIAYAEGNWPQAEKILAKAADKHEVPLINYITAAKAAHEQGNEERRDDYLLSLIHI